uniref:Uncharacterized protein n=1 Tax=Timema poppense TaxID=170557 RepID=A0A7R9H2H0_TIMPO|nr:unnamed protein product [Timema poppensis]
MEPFLFSDVIVVWYASGIPTSLGVILRGGRTIAVEGSEDGKDEDTRESKENYTNGGENWNSASKLNTVNMEDNLDTSSSKKDEMQLGPEYLVKDKIKIEPMLSGRIADIPVVTWPNSNIPEADVREVKLTTRLLGAGRGADLVPVSVSLLYPSHESGCVVARVCVPFDGERSRSDLMEFNSIKYFDGAVKSEVQDIFEPSSKSGSPSAELEEKLLLLNNESQKSFQMKTVIHDKTSPGESCRVQLSKEREPELLTNEKMEQSKNNETGIVKPDTSSSEDPEFMNVDEGFQLLNASLTLIVLHVRMGPTGLKPQAFASCLEQPSHLAAANRLPTASSSHLGLGFPLMILSIIRPNQGAGALTQDGFEEFLIEFVNMNIKLEVPEPSNDCVLPSTREENEMNLNSTKSEVDIFEPSSHCGFIFIKEEHEEAQTSSGPSHKGMFAIKEEETPKKAHIFTFLGLGIVKC